MDGRRYALRWHVRRQFAGITSDLPVWERTVRSAPTPQNESAIPKQRTTTHAEGRYHERASNNLKGTVRALLKRTESAPGRTDRA